MKRSDVEAILKEALRQLENDHQELLHWKVHERTLVSHLVCYLRGRFPGYSVDMEYNREGGECNPKRRPDGKTIVPDFVVHRRGDDDRNLLAVECKKSPVRGGDNEKDITKLKGLRDKMRYTHAAFVVLKSSGSKIFWV